MAKDPTSLVASKDGPLTGDELLVLPLPGTFFPFDPIMAKSIMNPRLMSSYELLALMQRTGMLSDEERTNCHSSLLLDRLLPLSRMNPKWSHWLPTENRRDDSVLRYCKWSERFCWRNSSSAEFEKTYESMDAKAIIKERSNRTTEEAMTLENEELEELSICNAQTDTF